jgi:DNA polymerase III epsilon subunit-like protein
MFRRTSSNDNVFNVPENIRIHRQVPDLIVGFDTETTGLNKEGWYHIGPHSGADEPLSYGLVVYRKGKPTKEGEYYITKPHKFSSPEAESVHGFSPYKLNQSYHGNVIQDLNGKQMHPAVNTTVGLEHMLQLLSHYQKQGAVFVGANHKFDIDIMNNIYRQIHGAPIETSGFNPKTAKLVDVIAHDIAIHPKDSRYERGHELYDSRSLSNLCQMYGVEPGGHSAVGDSHAAVQVFLKQIERNASGMPHPRQVINTRYSTKSLGETGIDYSKLHPCNGTKDCPACKHLTKILSEHKDSENGDPEHAKTVKKVLKMHKDMKGIA